MMVVPEQDLDAAFVAAGPDVRVVACQLRVAEFIQEPVGEEGWFREPLRIQQAKSPVEGRWYRTRLLELIRKRPVRHGLHFRGQAAQPLQNVCSAEIGIMHRIS